MASKRTNKKKKSNKEEEGGNSHSFLIALYAFIVIGVVGLLTFALLKGEKPADLPSEVMVELDQETIEVLMEMGKSLSIPMDRVDEILPTIELPWERFAVAPQKNITNPRIAIVIDDLGLSEKATIALAKMKPPLTLSFLPYGKELAWQTGTVRQAGHELMVHLPMEPKGETYADPGPKALLASLSDEEFDRNLDHNLRQFNGFVGVNNHMGSGLTENGPKMVRVLHYLKKEGFLFLDSLTSPKSKGTAIADKLGVPFLARDVFLDNNKDAKSIKEQLRLLERIAERRGYAVGIGHPYPETLAILKTWVETAEGRGYTLVPLSSLVKTPSGLFSNAEAMRYFGGQ